MPTQATFNHPDSRHLLRRISICPVPTDGTSNASYALAYTGSDLTQVDKTVNGDTFRRTLTWTGGKLTAVSTWTQV